MDDTASGADEWWGASTGPGADEIAPALPEPFAGCSPDLVVTCGLGSRTQAWCEESGVAYVLRQEDYSENPADWLN